MAGALNYLKPETEPSGSWRARLFTAIEDAVAYGQSVWNDRISGQDGLFGNSSSSESTLAPELPQVDAWPSSEVSRREKAALGFYLSAHPLDEFKETLAGLRIRNIADHGEFRAGANIVLAGLVSAAQVRWSKKGNRFCNFRLEDRSMGIKCLVWSDAYTKHAANLTDDSTIIVEGKVEAADGNDVTVIVNEVRPIAEQFARSAGHLTITLPKSFSEQTYLEDLFGMLLESPGRCDVFFEADVGNVRTRLHSPALSVQGSVSLTKTLESKGCSVTWSLQ